MPPQTLKPLFLSKSRLLSTSRPQPTVTSSDPIPILTSVWIRSFSRPHSPHPNLLGFLKNPSLWSLAYLLTCPRTSLQPSPPPPSLLLLRQSLLSSSFRWASAPSAILLRSPSDPYASLSASKKRAAASIAARSPPFQDLVVQQLLLLLLEPLFEPRFSPRSHAFRPGRSPRTVIRTIRSRFAAFLWFLKADLTAVSAQLDPSTVTSCVRKVVTDRKVLNLIRSAVARGPIPPEMTECHGEKGELRRKRLKRKVMRMTRRKRVIREDEPKPDPYWLRVFDSFAPEEAAMVPNIGRCGILSPLITNICLHELDLWLEEQIESYSRPSKLDPVCHNPSWPEFVPSGGRNRDQKRSMDFVRYGTHVLIGIRGPRGDAVKIRQELIEFCEVRYGVKLMNSSVEIEHVSRGVRFLDHLICRRVIYPTLRYTGTGGKIVNEKGVGTLLSVTASLERCITQFRKLGLLKGDRDPEPLPCVAMFYSGQAHTNAQMNKFLETMAEWYRYADNRKKIVGFCAYVIRSSLAKLYAARYRLKSRAKVYKMASRDLSKPLIESSGSDVPQYSDLLRMGLVDAIDGVQFSHMSLIPSCDYTPFPINWMPDHERVLREYVKLQDPQFFCKLYKSVKRDDLGAPQDDLSRIVWDCKTHGLHSSTFKDNMKKLGNSIDECSDDSKVASA